MLFGATRPLTGAFSLTAMQAGLAVESVLVDPASNIEQYVCRFDDEVVDVERMDAAWRGVQRRHDALRTTVHLDGPGGPHQRVHKDLEVALSVIDLSSMTAAGPAQGSGPAQATASAQERLLAEWLDDDRRQGLDLTSRSVMRLSLLVFGTRRTVLVWTFHHALLDGRSSAMVLEEALDCYDALSGVVSGAAPAEQAEPVPFGRHVEAVSRADTSAARQFFIGQFDGWEGPEGGPGPPPHDSEQNLRRGHRELELRLPASWIERAERRAAEVDATVGSILLAAWSVLLSRWSDTDDVAFGAIRSGRHAVPDADRIVGCLINTVPLRVRVDPDATVDDLLRSVRSFQEAVRPHEQTSLLDISEWLEVETDRPLLDTAVVYERELLDTRLRAKGGPWENRRVELLEQSSFPMMLSAHRDDGLRARIEYDSSRYDSETVVRIGGHLQRLLESMVDSRSDTAVVDLPLLTDVEVAVLVNDRNPSGWVAADGSYIDRFEECASTHPDSIAVELVDGGASITYAELDERANRLAHLLLAHGAAGGQPVALCLPRSPDFIVAMLATLKASAPYLPLDPDYPEDELAHRLGDSGARLVVATESTAPALSSTDVQLLVISDVAQALAEQPPTAPSRATTDPGAPSYVIYTSGTTGRPKGVMISDGSLLDLCRAVADRYELSERDRVLQFCSLSFDVSVEEIAPTLLVGATVVLRSAELSSSMAALIDSTAKDRLSVLNLPSAIWHTLVVHLERSGARLSRSVRLVVVGGEKVSRHAYEAWSTVHPEIRWLNGYGPTETTVTCTSFDPRGHYEVGSGRELPIGRPLPNARAYLLDRSGQNLVPDGAAGELWIGGTGVALGYLGMPELTAERFRLDPFVEDPGARMYRTGDRCRWSADGELEYVGRTDRQIKLRGHRIEPGHVERRLEQLEGVGQAFVSIRSGASGADRLVGWVVPAESAATLDTHALREQVRRLLPDFLVPAALVQVDVLPRTAAAKVDVAALPDPPVVDRRAISDELRVDEDVAHICRLFTEVVGHEADPDDSFFEIGGNSLVAVRLIGMVDDELGVRLSLPELIASPTPRELARSLAARSTGERAAYLTAIQPSGSLAPIYGLHVIGENGSFYRPLADRLGADQPVFGVAIRPDEHSPTAVGDIAAVYVEEIQRHRPDGPLVVAGLSLAAFVAFEVAQQLVAAGREVVLVVLLDSAAPGGERSVGLVRRVAIHLRKLRRGGLSYLRSSAARLVGSMRQASWTIRVRVQQLLGRPTPENLWVHRFVLANVRSVEDYEARPCSSALLVVHAAGEEFDDPDVVRTGFGWGPYAAGGLEVVDVPGDHMSMLEEPNVGVLAEQIRVSMSNATRTRS